MADNIAVTAGAGTIVATDDVGSAHYQRIKRSVGADGSATDFLDKVTRSDTYTGAASGTVVDISAQGMKHWSLQVKGTGGVPTAWVVQLVIGLDGTNGTAILWHRSVADEASPASADGTIVSLPVPAAALYVKSQVISVTLGPASNLVATILGLP